MNNQKRDIIIYDDRFCCENTLFFESVVYIFHVFCTDLLKNILKNIFAKFRIV